MHPEKCLSMKVLKFGGTSVGSVQGIRNVKNIISTISDKKLIVLSAMSGVTNTLVELSQAVKNNNDALVDQIIGALLEKHILVIEELIQDINHKTKAKAETGAEIDDLKTICSGNWDAEADAIILTTGERLLTQIFHNFINAEGLNSTFLDSRNFMYVENLENPDTAVVGDLLQEVMKKSNPNNIYVTQGFLRIDQAGKVSTLKRGGSDYTATIIGAAVHAEEVQIWTDIDGLHNNDPRYVEHTHAIETLSFEEAAELAYFGAKILHPQTISPVIDKHIPVFLKNTFTPEAKGTCICSETDKEGLKAISAKDGITAIKIKSNRMLMAHGFLKKIFEVFDAYQTPIDMITTSEIAISLTIDDDRNLDQIIKELEKFGQISVDQEHSIICVVGEGLINDKETFRLFEILNDIPVRMISYGGSSNNISLLVETDHKIKTLQLLHQKLFRKEPVLG